MENVATIENQPVQIPIVTCDFASDVSTSEADPGGSVAMEEKDTLKVFLFLNFQLWKNSIFLSTCFKSILSSSSMK